MSLEETDMLTSPRRLRMSNSNGVLLINIPLQPKALCCSDPGGQFAAAAVDWHFRQKVVNHVRPRLIF
jgi:hypothetical protein